MGLGQIALQGGGAVLLAVLVWLAMARWHAGPAQVLPLVALFARALPLLGCCGNPGRTGCTSARPWPRPWR